MLSVIQKYCGEDESFWETGGGDISPCIAGERVYVWKLDIDALRSYERDHLYILKKSLGASMGLSKGVKPS